MAIQRMDDVRQDVAMLRTPDGHGHGRVNHIGGPPRAKGWRKGRLDLPR
ncbi:hypothetical protein [Streptomyces sp. SLBN-8D4]|jgi:hypothetical protein